MIEIRQCADGASRSPDRPCYYDAACTVAGADYAARARYGVVNDLARQLVAAGVPDQEVRVVTQGVSGAMTYRSLHRLATRTVSEGRTEPLRDVKWRDPSEAFAALGSKAVLSQGTPAEASEHPDAVLAAK